MFNRCMPMEWNLVMSYNNGVTLEFFSLWRPVKIHKHSNVKLTFLYVLCDFYEYIFCFLFLCFNNIGSQLS